MNAQSRHEVNHLHALREDGFTIVEQLIDDGDVRALIESLAIASQSDARRAGHGRRNLFEIEAVRRLACDAAIRGLVASIVGHDDAFAVRAILFDKSPGANWFVGWHQDRAIAVAERHDVAGFGPWSVKAGVPHVEPPTNVLERMVTVRVALDAADEDNGGLRVLPGSHRLGVLSPQQLHDLDASAAVTPDVPRGGALLMRPLLLHASSQARQATHRRVIHLEFAAESLPSPLDWHDRVQYIFAFCG